VAAALLTAACASGSPFVSTWKNPDAAPVSLAGKKILAVVQVREETRRRVAEDALAAEITARGGQGIPSYTLFSTVESKEDTLMARVHTREAGIAGVVIMHFDPIQHTVTVEPRTWVNDPFYRRPWGAWRQGWGTAYAIDDVRTETKLSVETRVYSLEQDRLLWAGISETWNPAKSADVVRDLSSAVVKQLQEIGLLK
jgi:hypothetical protein